MKIKEFIDYNGNPIDSDMVYNDIKNDVSDIYIVSHNSNYYAQPDGLDKEPLASVCKNLVPSLNK